MTNLVIPDLDRNWLNLLQQQRAIAVIRSDQKEIAWQMALAVAVGGMRLIEITWNSDRPGELIRELRQELPDCTIGCGTVLNQEQLQQAVTSGSQFVFTPHVDRSLIQTARSQGIPIIPGALTPTEIVLAADSGASSVKIFPIQAVGGVSYLRLLQGPLGQIPLIPTGGVTIANARDFLAAGAVAVGVASDLFPQKAIKTGDWRDIHQRAAMLLRNCNH